MMKLEASIRGRLEDLQSRVSDLSHEHDNGHALDDVQEAECLAWLTQASNVVRLICPDMFSPYRSAVDGVMVRTAHTRPRGVRELAAVLRALLADVNSGLIGSIHDRVSGEVFDNFLDHAQAYVKSKNKQQAGAIAGVVFEDTVRQICRKFQVVEKSIHLENLINELARKGILSATKAKWAKVAAHVRTKATHAQWDEFELSDVKTTIDLSRDLINTHLDA